MLHSLRYVILAVALSTSGTSWAVTVTIINIDQPSCGFNNGRMHASFSGGIPPYSLLWSTGAITADITGLAPGTYSVTVTDGMGNTATDNTTLTMSNTGMTGLSVNSAIYDCNGWCASYASIDVSGLQGVGPFIYNPEPNFVNGDQLHFGGLCDGFLDLTVTDANGCVGNWNFSFGSATGATLSAIDQSDACGGLDNGMFMLQVSDFWGGFSHCVTVTDLPSGVVVDEFQLVSDGATLLVDSLPPSVYNVTVVTCDGMGGNYCPGSPIDVTIGDAGSPCGTLQGMVYHDADQDCVFNGFDLVQPYRVITIDPVGAYAITDGAGHYQQNLGYGTFDVSHATYPNETQLCPAATPQPVTIDAFSNNVTLDFANLSNVPHDLAVHLWSANARPGFPTQLWVTVANTTAFPSGNVSLNITYDPLLLNVSPATLPLALGVIAPYSQAHRMLSSDVPADINLLGTVINYTATFTNTATETSLANNSASLDVTITGAYDPNDKQGITSSAISPSQYFLDQDEWVTYTIRFQNTGTAAAETVTIRDTIDSDLSIPSLDILGASHDFTPSFGEGRALTFTFNNIDLPDSTSDLLGSQGFISYRIKPNNDIVVGDVLENTAGIYFDLNPPVITNTVTHVVDFSTGLQGQAQAQGQLLLLPNPARDVLNVIIQNATTSCDVLGLDGRRMQVPGTRRADGFQLDVRSLQAGTYLIRTGNSVARFVKQ